MCRKEESWYSLPITSIPEISSFSRTALSNGFKVKTDSKEDKGKSTVSGKDSLNRLSMI
jgi:hypothetical protein